MAGNKTTVKFVVSKNTNTQDVTIGNEELPNGPVIVPTAPIVTQTVQTKAPSNTPVATITPTGIPMATQKPGQQDNPIGSKDCVNHVWRISENPVLTYPSTCINNGKNTYTCLFCAATKTEAEEALGHDYREPAVKPEAQCNDMIYNTICSRCGCESSTKTYVVEGKGHTWGVNDGKYISGTGSCTEPKQYYKHCTVC